MLNHLYFCIDFVIYLLFIYVLQDSHLSRNNFITRHCSTLWKYMSEKHGYLFSYGKLAYKRVYGLCAIYKHSKN